MDIPSSLTDRRRRLLAWTVAVIAVLALSIPVGLYVLGHRSSGGTSAGGSSAIEPSTAESPLLGKGAESRDGSAVPEAATPQAAPDVAAAASTAKLVRSAWLGIQVTDLTAAAAKVRAIAATAGGQVLSENVVTTSAPRDITGELGDVKVPPVGPSEARLVLGVPSDKLDGVLTELSSRIGTVSYRSSQSQDVTDTYVDTKARVVTMEAGVDRLRALLTKATSLEQIITLESELTRRQADLDALKARLADLDQRVAQSEVTVTLWTSEAEPVVEDDDGFLSALRGAWEAFLSSLAVIFTGLAVLLPWLVIVLLVVLVARRVLRRRGRASTTD
jgi:hypothetical protein